MGIRFNDYRDNDINTSADNAGRSQAASPANAARQSAANTQSSPQSSSSGAASLPGPVAAKALSEAGLPDNARNRQIVSSLVSQELPIDADTLKSIARIMSAYPGESIEAVILLHSAGVEVTPSALADADAFLAARDMLLDALNDINSYIDGSDLLSGSTYADLTDSSSFGSAAGQIAGNTSGSQISNGQTVTGQTLSGQAVNGLIPGGQTSGSQVLNGQIPGRLTPGVQTELAQASTGQAVNGQTIGGHIINGQNPGGQIFSEQSVGAQTEFAKTSTGQAVDGHTLNGQTIGGHITNGQNPGGQIFSEQSVGTQTELSQTSTGQAVNGQTLNDQTIGGHITNGQNPDGQIHSEQSVGTQTELAQNSSGQAVDGQTINGQTIGGHITNGQNPGGQLHNEHSVGAQTELAQNSSGQAVDGQALYSQTDGVQLSNSQNLSGQNIGTQAGISQDSNGRTVNTQTGNEQSVQTDMGHTAASRLSLKDLLVSLSQKPGIDRSDISSAGIKKFLESAVTYLENARELSGRRGDEAMAAKVDKAMNSMRTLLKLNDMYAYAEVPVKNEDENRRTHLRFFANKKSRIRKDEGSSAVLHLNMPSLKELDVKMVLKGNSLKVDFFSSKDASKYLEADSDSLSERLRAVGVEPTIGFDERKENNPALDPSAIPGVEIPAVSQNIKGFDTRA